jgi:molybdate transport system ATP-binding protein
MTAPPTCLHFQATKSLHTAQGTRQFDVTFDLPQGRLLALYGPSGAGKTTLLRILAGLTDTSSGNIVMEGDTWLDHSRRFILPTRRRPIGFVFQDFALFPHLTVRQQLEYALPKDADRSIIPDLLTLMELETLQHHRPTLLSGGQQQRIAIARAIARRPRLLLLDEPLSALDEEMRSKLQDYIAKAHRHFHLTTVLVSHYLPEIHALADEVIILDEGKITSRSIPSDLFPATGPIDNLRLNGEITAITQAYGACILHVLAAGTTINVVASPDSASAWRIGQKVTVAYRDFNPVILHSH